MNPLHDKRLATAHVGLQGSVLMVLLLVFVKSRTYPVTAGAPCICYCTLLYNDLRASIPIHSKL